ncbi:MAG TPA: hypothetical protein VK272_07880 [Solirubrobacteraceae bacterium]|nr:hypothetical protein [Solirubrobacteraceae bacterium]
MKRISIVGLCLVAAFALSAIVAGGAQAGTANWFKCASVKKGEFTNNTCTTKASKKGKGKFELQKLSSCISVKKGEYTNNTCTTKASKKGKGKFEKVALPTISATTGTAKLATPAFGSGKVECKGSTAAGQITSSDTATEQVKFTGCQLEGKECTSFEGPGGDGTPSGEAGVILTNVLDLTLVGHGEKAGGHLHLEPASGEAWSEIVGTKNGVGTGAFSSEFVCGGEVVLHTNGSVSGVDSGVNGPVTTTNETKFALGLGEEGLLTQVFTGVEFVPPGGAESTEETTATNKSSEAITIVAP